MPLTQMASQAKTGLFSPLQPSGKGRGPWGLNTWARPRHARHDHRCGSGTPASEEAVRPHPRASSGGGWWDKAILQLPGMRGEWMWWGISAHQHGGEAHCGEVESKAVAASLLATLRKRTG
jgi:hypothetical protein